MNKKNDDNNIFSFYVTPLFYALIFACIAKVFLDAFIAPLIIFTIIAYVYRFIDPTW